MAAKKLFTPKTDLTKAQLQSRREKVLALAEKAGLDFFGYANNKGTRMNIGLSTGKEKIFVVGWVADVEAGTMKSIIPNPEGIAIPKNFKKVSTVLNNIKKML
jgi:hypothetical protein